MAVCLGVMGDEERLEFWNASIRYRHVCIRRRKV